MIKILISGDYLSGKTLIRLGYIREDVENLKLS